MRLKFADIPLRFKGAAIGDITDEANLKVINDFLWNDEYWRRVDYRHNGNVGWFDETWRCLVINGPVGTGKTHTACAIVNEYCTRANAIYTTAYAMSQRIIKDRDSEYFKGFSLLVIDELGRSFETKAEKDRFFDLINYRYENLKPVVFLGNFKLDQLKQALGEAVADRVGADMKFITLTGKSRR